MKILLYSGGMDTWLIDKIWKPDKKIYIDIGGKYNEAEKKRLGNDVEILPFPLLGRFEQADNYVPMRNLYFLMIASHFGNKICLGATSGDGGADKNINFLYSAESIINSLLQDKKVGRSIEIEKQFIKYSKADLIERYLDMGGTANEIKEKSFSCYSPVNGEECGECYPCFRKFALLSYFGATYTEAQERKMWEYIKKNIIPTKEQGGYNGTYYTDRGEESTYLIACVENLRRKYDS